MLGLLSLSLSLFVSAALAAEPAQFRADALALETLVNEKYAYLERLPGGRYTLSPELRAEAQTVTDPRSLVRYAERALALLADHHAITGSSLKTSRAVFPSYGDLWIERRGSGYVVDQVRVGSPAEQAGVRTGDRLMAGEGVPTAAAVAAFWSELGATGGGERDGYAARVLASGRRDRERSLTFVRGAAPPRTLALASLYQVKNPDGPPLTALQRPEKLTIRFHDSLGDRETIAAFDAAMAQARPGQQIVLDLTDTPSGGNTTIARRILGWFVDRPRPYQVHSLPAEQRETGVARQWIEQVLPRPGKHHPGTVTVRVGRWTGSMGEGLAIGFAALGARVEGSRMAGLLGAIHDQRLPNSGLVIKLPTERLDAVNGTPREKFVPTAMTRALQD